MGTIRTSHIKYSFGTGCSCLLTGIMASLTWPKGLHEHAPMIWEFVADWFCYDIGFIKLFQFYLFHLWFQIQPCTCRCPGVSDTRASAAVGLIDSYGCLLEDFLYLMGICQRISCILLGDLFRSYEVVTRGQHLPAVYKHTCYSWFKL